VAVLAEFEIDSPVLREALAAVPDAVAEIEEYDDSGPNGTRLFVRVRASDFDAFETAIESDDTVAEYERLVTSSSRSFYRLRLSESGSGSLTYRFAIEHDVLPLSSRGTHEGWHVRARFPDRESIAEYWEHCRSTDVHLELRTVYSQNADATDGIDDVHPNLTPEQREAIVLALNRGYFDVPRGTSLRSIADVLGISDTAVSYRLRRGLKTLVEGSIGSGGDDGQYGGPLFRNDEDS